jgi:hypothetical protein
LNQRENQKIEDVCQQILEGKVILKEQLFIGLGL